MLVVGGRYSTVHQKISVQHDISGWYPQKLGQELQYERLSEDAWGKMPEAHELRKHNQSKGPYPQTLSQSMLYSLNLSQDYSMWRNIMSLSEVPERTLL